jgi:hypothetical protein
MPQKPTNPLDATRQKIMEIVNADPFLQSVNCLLDEKGDLDAKVEAQLAKLGLALIFEIEKGVPSFPAAGAFKMELTASFTVLENVLINRDPGNTSASGKTAADVIVRLFEVFHPMTPNNPLTLGEFNLISDVSSVVNYNVSGKVLARWTPKTEE